jgi:hypothetical protein
MLLYLTMSSPEQNPLLNPEKELKDEDLDALKRFRDNPKLLHELLAESSELRARALESIFSQESYVQNSRLSLEEFTVLAEKGPTSSNLEVVPLRKSPTGKTQVLLYKRPSSDQWWPEELHSPGTVILPADLKEGHLPFERILGEEGELKGGIHTTNHPVYVNYEARSAEDTGRGPEIALVHYIEADGDNSNDPTVGIWVDVDNTFPDNADGQVIKHHIPMIEAAAAKFDADKKEQARIAATGSTALHPLA